MAMECQEFGDEIGVIRKMSCFVCDKSFNVRPGTTRHLRPNQLTSNLQDRKWEPRALKPDVTILEALEDISDGDVTLEMLKIHAAQYICHECQINLRQAVNKKAEVEHNIQLLNEGFGKVSNKDRKDYYREHYLKEKSGRCWGCMYQFVAEDFQKRRSDRFHLATPVVEGMSVVEAISSVLEEEAQALIGLYEKKTYICKKCVQLLRNVVKSQCVFDTLQTSFKSITNEDSVLARLMRGEHVPFIMQPDEDFSTFDDEDVGSSSGPMDSISSSPVKSLSDPCPAKYGKRPFHKAIGNLQVVPRQSTSLPKKRKLPEDTDNEQEDTDFEIEEENVAENEDIEMSDLQNMKTDSERVSKLCSKETPDSGRAVFKIISRSKSGLSVKTHMIDHTDVTKVKTPVIDTGVTKHSDNYSAESKGFNTAGELCENTPENVPENNSKNSENVKKIKCVHLKLSLKGDEVKAFAVEEDEGNRQGVHDSVTIQHNKLKEHVMSDDWVLYYYPVFGGRAEFVRLIFEEAGVPYRECDESFTDIRRLIINGEMEGYPHFAPPMVKKGNLQVSQTPVICRFLGEEFGLYPDSLEDRLHAEQINQCCHDFIAEGRLSFHGINPVGPYLSQKTETQPFIDRFVSERLPRWLKYFERVLAANKGGKGFLYGEKMCYCDLGLFHVIHATESQFSDVYKAADYIPLLKSFKERIASRPRIASYLSSERWRGFCGDSMM